MSTSAQRHSHERVSGHRVSRHRWRAVGMAAAAVAGLLGPAALAGHAGAATRAAPLPTVRGWGDNTLDSLGSGSTANFKTSPIKVKLPKGDKVTAVRAGCDGSVALLASGGVLAWGANSQGEDGDGTSTLRPTPVRVHLPKGTRVTQVRAGCDHDLALTKSGKVLAWGAGGDGQVGDGTGKDRHLPTAVHLPKGTTVTAISAGCNDSLALTKSGKVLAWGDNGSGQLGDGTFTPRHLPVTVKLPAGTTASLIAAGCDFSFALTKQGLYGWGNNTAGQLGDGDTTSTNTPTLISMLFRGTGPGVITGLYAGCQHTIALFSKGGVLAWGDNTYGQLGNGTTTGSDKPTSVSIPPGDKIKSLSAYCYGSLALTGSGQVLAWGYNVQGEVGDGTTVSRDTPVPVALNSGLDTTVIGSGPAALHSFAISAG
jgi:alpha-tubulin suppressor-like RCC1 family protein